MADEIKYQINVQMADNTVTKDDPDDKIFNVVSQGTADKERVIAEMMAVNPGLERETLRHVLDLENRVVMKLLLNGMRVNNGLFEAAPQCKGVVRGTAWDPAVNSIYVNFKQGKEMREAIRSTTINVIGEKGSTFYLSTSLDAATGATDFSSTSGANLTLTGRNIKVAGDDPSVGVLFTNVETPATTVKVGLEDITVNEPSRLIFVLPAQVTDGLWTVSVTTQYSNGRYMLKEPRTYVLDTPLGVGSAYVDPGQGSGTVTPGGDDDDDSGQGTFG